MGEDNIRDVYEVYQNNNLLLNTCNNCFQFEIVSLAGSCTYNNT